jgi:hypothetical protein
VEAADVQRMDAYYEAQHGPVAAYTPQRVGFVYFLQSAEGGPVKIGWARNVEARRDALQTAHPYPLVLLGKIPGGPGLEKELHTRFANDRCPNGEWFEPSDELLGLIPVPAEVAA